MKAVKANVKFVNENKQKASYYNFDCLFSIGPLVCRGIFTEGSLSIQVFLADRHYGLIVGSLR